MPRRPRDSRLNCSMISSARCCTSAGMAADAFLPFFAMTSLLVVLLPAAHERLAQVVRRQLLFLRHCWGYLRQNALQDNQHMSPPHGFGALPPGLPFFPRAGAPPVLAFLPFGASRPRSSASSRTFVSYSSLFSSYDAR